MIDLSPLNVYINYLKSIKTILCVSLYLKSIHSNRFIGITELVLAWPCIYRCGTFTMFCPVCCLICCVEWILSGTVITSLGKGVCVGGGGGGRVCVCGGGGGAEGGEGGLVTLLRFGLWHLSVVVCWRFLLVALIGYVLPLLDSFYT